MDGGIAGQALVRNSEGNSDEDGAGRTIEFLRARLLSERSISGAANHKSHQLLRKVQELERQLDCVITQRRRAEKATREALSLLENNHDEGFDEYEDRGIDPTSSSSSSSSSSTHKAHPLGSSDSDTINENPHHRALTWQSSTEDNKSRLHSPSLNISRTTNPYLEKGFRSSVSSVSRSKRIVATSRRQFKRREIREPENEERKQMRGEVETIPKDISMDGNANVYGNRFAEFLQLPNESDHHSAEMIEEYLSENSHFMEAHHKSCVISSSNSGNVEIEKAMEQQAKLIHQYEVEEHAQQEWERQQHPLNGKYTELIDSLAPVASEKAQLQICLKREERPSKQISKKSSDRMNRNLTSPPQDHEYKIFNDHSDNLETVDCSTTVPERTAQQGLIGSLLEVEVSKKSNQGNSITSEDILKRSLKSQACKLDSCHKTNEDSSPMYEILNNSDSHSIYIPNRRLSKSFKEAGTYSWKTCQSSTEPITEKSNLSDRNLDSNVLVNLLASTKKLNNNFPGEALNALRFAKAQLHNFLDRASTSGHPSQSLPNNSFAGVPMPGSVDSLAIAQLSCAELFRLPSEADKNKFYQTGSLNSSLSSSDKTKNNRLLAPSGGEQSIFHRSREWEDAVFFREKILMDTKAKTSIYSDTVYDSLVNKH